jgi:hypothetical protein
MISTLWRLSLRRTIEEYQHCEVRPRRMTLSEGRVGWAAPEGISLQWTPCHFGGERPWLVCPQCGARRLRLYGLGAEFRCRGCLGLAYWSQRLRRVDRAHKQRSKLRLRLGGNGDVRANLPPKPPRVHWRTYLKAIRREAELQDVIAGALMPRLVRLERQAARILR